MSGLRREVRVLDPQPQDASASNRIGVLLAEDMHMMRAAIVALLDLEPDIEVLVEVASGELIVPAALEHRPDVAVLDIDLPVVDGITAAIDLHAQLPEVHTLMLTTLGRPGTLRRAMNAHVGGYVLKDAPPEQLSDAIRAVAKGQRYIDSQLAMTAWASPDCPLTVRELEVLRLTSQGSRPGEIADRLHLTTGTVRNYLTNIDAKLNARSRVDAVRLAEDAGWL